MISSDARQFHDDLSAAIVAGVPIEMNSLGAHTEGSRSTLTDIGNWRSLVQPGIERNETLEQIFKENPGLPGRYCAALKVFERTGSMQPVLDGLTVAALSREQATRALRWTFIYLLLVMVAALIGLIVFMTRAIPSVEAMRTDLLLPATMNGPQQFDLTPWYPTIVTALAIIIGLLLFALVLGGATKLVYRLGGRRFIQTRKAKVALRTVRMLMVHGTEVNSAVVIGCDLVDADPMARREIQASVCDEQHVDGAVKHLSVLEDYAKKSADQRLRKLRVATPIAMVAGVGGLIGLFYGLAIFWPIVALLKDLASVGT